MNILHEIKQKPMLALGTLCLLLIVCIFGTRYFFIARAETSKTIDDVVRISTPTGQGVPADDALIFLDIEGAVKTPGVYKLKLDSRLIDLLTVAGGLLESANYSVVSKNLNLSAKLKDSDKVYIPFDWETSIVTKTDLSVDPYTIPEENFVPVSSGDSIPKVNTTAADTAAPKVNVNEATLTELDSLSGIGKSYAQRIIDSRPYTDFAGLTAKSGVPRATLEKLKDLLLF